MDTLNHIERALAASSLIWWEWKLATNTVTYNDRKVIALGYDPADYRDCGFEAFTALIHPDDHDRAMQAMRNFISGKSPIYRVDYRMKRSDGTYTWYVDRGFATDRDANGRPLVMRGFVFDLGPQLQRDALDRRIISLVRAALPTSGTDDATVTVVCSGCKRLKLGHREWIEVTGDLALVYPERLSHGICPECIETLYPEYAAG
jgi:hypothetical protein